MLNTRPDLVKLKDPERTPLAVTVALACKDGFVLISHPSSASWDRVFACLAIKFLDKVIPSKSFGDLVTTLTGTACCLNKAIKSTYPSMSETSITLLTKDNHVGESAKSARNGETMYAKEFLPSADPMHSWINKSMSMTATFFSVTCTIHTNSNNALY